MRVLPNHPLSTWHPSIADPEPIAPSPNAAEVALLRLGFGRFLVFESTLRRLAAAARRERCPPGPLAIDSPCIPEAAWWLVASGTVSVGAAWDGFVEQRRLGPGEWLDIAGALSAPCTWIERAVCRTAVELLAVPLSAIVEACTVDTTFTAAFAGVLADRVRELSVRVDDMAGADAHVRLARWLLRQIEPGSDGRGSVRVVLTQRKHQIARQLSTTSETLSRTLRSFCDAGVIAVRDYEFTILDVAALRSLASARSARRRKPHGAAPTSAPAPDATEGLPVGPTRPR